MTAVAKLAVVDTGLLIPALSNIICTIHTFTDGNYLLGVTENLEKCEFRKIWSQTLTRIQYVIGRSPSFGCLSVFDLAVLCWYIISKVYHRHSCMHK